MSAQSDAKAAQGYVAKPVPSTCGNCARFAYDLLLPIWAAKEKAAGRKDWEGVEYTIEEYGVEKNLRCTLGSFAVKKMATCNQFAPKAPA
jgi:hypothetical protein